MLNGCERENEVVNCKTIGEHSVNGNYYHYDKGYSH